MCRRSWNVSLFSRNFLNESYRISILEGIRKWHPSRYTVKIYLEKEIKSLNQLDALRLLFILSIYLVTLPFRYLILLFSVLSISLEKPIIRPSLKFISFFLERNYIFLNLFSNPLINAGIVFELLFCYVLFYSPLAKIYYFAPVPWHVYLFAFNGTFMLLTFEETKKYFRRKGKSLTYLG
jgi:hypothetical protein